jgi:hypothetical protein
MSRSPRTRVLAPAACLCLAWSAVALTPAVSASAETGDARARVVRDWNAIAVRTIATEAALGPPPAQLHLGLVSSAVYDAVTHAPPGRASVSAAVATAAHDVLSASFPGAAGHLDADLATTLAAVPDGPLEDRGVAVGAAAADRLLASRAPLSTSITLPVDPAPGPGEWRPTPPAFAPMAFAWLGFVDPLLLPSPTSIDVGGPDAITSPEYAADVDEVRRIGRLDSTDPDADAAHGHFGNAPVGVVYNTALREWADRSGLGARATARMFALLNMTTADAIITCWRMKYDHRFWRPITAVREADTDGNDATTAVPTWSPVVATPPYPEWPTGHGCLTSSFVRGLTRLTGSDAIDLDISNPVTGETRHYSSAAALRRSAFISRIQLGIHFRDAMEDGYRVGRIASDRGFAAFDR